MEARKYNYLVGIDPGVETGLAVYDTAKKKLIAVITMGIVDAMEYVLALSVTKVFVRVEDARLRTWFGDADREKLQGAGSIKRDCSIWDEFLKRHKIAYELTKPKDGKTKVDAGYFNKLTGWTNKTTNHSRDAAMLVFGF